MKQAKITLNLAGKKEYDVEYTIDKGGSDVKKDYARRKRYRFL